MTNKPFTIIAFPRSGTKFVAQLLYLNGILCSHEHEHPMDNLIPPPYTWNLISWCPFDWDKVWRNYGTRIKLTRNPHDVVKSWPCLELAVRQVLKEYTGYADFDNIYRAWDKILDSRSDATFKVEEVVSKWDEFVELLGYGGVKLRNFPGDSINTLRQAINYNSWLSELDAAEFGYMEE